MRRAVRTFVFLLLGLAGSAYASTISAGTYSLSNAYADGYSLTGTVTFNASGFVTGADITLNDPAYFNPTFTSVNSTGSGGNNPVAYFAYIAGNGSLSGGQIALYYLDTLNSDGSIEICLLNQSCNGYQASYTQVYFPSGFNGNHPADLTSGVLVGASATPEPSSLALLGTGVLAAAGAMRRRFLRA